MRAYSQFCAHHEVSPIFLSVYDILSYILFLLDRLKCPGAFLSYIGTVKMWMSANSGVSAGFFSDPEHLLLKKGIARTSKHIPSHASSVSSIELRKIILYLASLYPNPFVVMVALLLLYQSTGFKTEYTTPM